jgi:glycine/D-amino acid oxidase-like deaminating enzyme
MLETFKAAGGRRLMGQVEAIERKGGYLLRVKTEQGYQNLEADRVVNAAGPFADDIAQMLNVDLPIYNSFQQKIAFEDTAKAIPRDMPFSIDLDGQLINWSDEERDMLLADDDFAWLASQMPGAIHCRPDGGNHGNWLKLGWAYNEEQAKASRDLPLDDAFPEIVLRGAARLNPSLAPYCDALPVKRHHYGGWYTMTKENWPLIGPMDGQGAFMNCGLSGFGTMAACAGGELCAAWVAGAQLPSYAREFSMARYEDKALMTRLYAASKGVL